MGNKKELQNVVFFHQSFQYFGEERIEQKWAIATKNRNVCILVVCIAYVYVGSVNLRNLREIFVEIATENTYH